MATMRPLQTLSLLGFGQLLQVSSCHRFSNSLVKQELLQQCSTFTTSANEPPFGYRIAAAFSAKGRRFNPKSDLFEFESKGAAGQRPNSGQDAFFVGGVGDSSDVAFGVADGVGGWSDSGIDSADFSHGLCKYMEQVARTRDTTGQGRLKAAYMIQAGYDKAVADRSIAGGGTTVCAGVGGHDGNLEVAK